MGTDNLHHKRKRENFKKKERESKAVRWLVVCEGEQTEPNYFSELNAHLKNSLGTNYKLVIEIVGEGKNTISLVDKTIELKQKSDIDYAKVFTIFDRDSFLKNQFNDAIYMCCRNGVIPIWSNESFELWYLLHFISIDAEITREQYCEKLNNHLGFKYDKSCETMFSILGGKLKCAYNRSKNLEIKIKECQSFADKKPCTMMHVFIDELIKELDVNGIDFWDVVK